MYRFRLRSATAGVYRGGAEKPVAVLIPAGAEVTTTDEDALSSSANHLKLISVEWQGRPLAIFLIDLVERGERIAQMGE
jgi:hypothetical protein